jgi:uncharacterized protein YyaL (SSP411 family)
MMSNRLAQSSSAYLRSAAHQPIEWYEFGDEAFERAKSLDRPVLLDIGAVWCHWCHVIDRESYEDPEIAELINEHYVAIKVDRDQRPDIDARYQQVVMSLSGQGGWPLTGFLTHDGRVIYGGTYFPPQAMKSLLLKIKDLYHEKKGEMFQAEDLLSAENAQAKAAQEAAQAGPLPPVEETFLETLLQSMKERFDEGHGGFGIQPKFPHLSALSLLVAQLHRVPDDTLRHVLTQTLDAMARGGVYDQVAGGFHRYSVDRVWHVPHFEKMAYDNAEAIGVYSQAFRLTGNPFYKEVACRTMDWVMRELSDSKQGGFYASQDADIDLNDDGDHFTWTLDEVRAVTSPQEYSLLTRYYDLTPAGDMHERPGRNVLRVVTTLEETARQLGISPDEAGGLLASAQTKMLTARTQRPIPFIDTTLYTNLNAMMIAAFLESADLLELPEARQFALTSLDRILDHFYQPGQTVLHAEGVPGFLDDYAQLAMACLKAYYTTTDKRYRLAASDIADLLLRDFEDPDLGGFYDIRHAPEAHGLLKFRRKPFEDSPSSSANGVALQVLIALEQLTGEARYRETVDRSLRFFVDRAENYGFYVSALGLAVFQFLYPPLKLEVVGQSEPLAQEARAFFYPGKLVAYSPTEAGTSPQIRPCFAQRCLAPVEEGQSLRDAMSATTLGQSR